MFTSGFHQESPVPPQSLDEVQVGMETCSELRSHSVSSVLPSYSSGGRYGFADKVIDGMTVTVNSVLITFRSHAFHATFQVSACGILTLGPSGVVQRAAMAP